jgi:hypothetical protein
MENAHTDGKTSSGTSSHDNHPREGRAASFDWSQLTKNLPLEAILASHRRNVETMRQAQQTAGELVRELMQLNSQHARQTFDEACHFVRSAAVPSGTSPMGGKEVGMLTDAVRNAFERSIAHNKQVTDLFSRSTSKVFNAYKDRFEEGVKEVQSMGESLKI